MAKFSQTLSTRFVRSLRANFGARVLVELLFVTLAVRLTLHPPRSIAAILELTGRRDATDRCCGPGCRGSLAKFASCMFRNCQPVCFLV
jgi:hypothetical protein